MFGDLFPKRKLQKSTKPKPIQSKQEGLMPAMVKDNEEVNVA